MPGCFDAPLELPLHVFEEEQLYVVYQNGLHVGVARIIATHINEPCSEGYLHTIDASFTFDDEQDVVESTYECEVDETRNSLFFSLYEENVATYTCYADSNAVLGVYAVPLRDARYTFVEGHKYLVYKNCVKTGVATIISNMINAPVGEEYLRTVYTHIQWDDGRDPVECVCLCYIDRDYDHVSFKYWDDDSTCYICHSTHELVCQSNSLLLLLLH